MVKRFSRFLMVVLFVALFLMAKAAGFATAYDGEESAAALPPVQAGPIAFLTGPAEGDPLQIAEQYLQAHYAESGLTSADLAEKLLWDQFMSQHNQTTHIYWRQRLAGIEVYNGDIAVHVAADGSIIAMHNQFVADLRGKVNSTEPRLTAAEAVNLAAVHLGRPLRAPLQVVKHIGGPAQEVVFDGVEISLEDIPVKLVYQPLEGGRVRLAWDLSIYELNAQNWWSMRLDAESGAVLSQVNWVVNDNWGPAGAEAVHAETAQLAEGVEAVGGNVNVAADPLAPDQYQVYHIPVESPSHSVPATPADGRTVVVNPADALASPYGWHDTNGAAGAEYTVTRGNNVYAYTDTDANNTPDAGSSPDGGPTLNFSFALNLNNAPSTYRPAAVTNLFHWNNLMHDVWYQYGFDEASRNFQVNNYGRGGTGNDAVLAEAQDGSGTNNANFATPAEGSQPRMQMYLWTAPTPDRDGDFDNGIVAHEYGHGISNRLTGTGIGCLSNTEQMGEGWSDYFGVVMTIESGDAGTDRRGVGTYALNQPTNGTGIRTYPYSTDMVIDPRTYDTIKTAAVPHGVGSTWAAMLWEMTWALINDYGFDPNIYTGTGGNNISMQLVIDGLKLQPCSPGFVTGRNAILQADLNNYGGAHQCLIWTAFAKRGLGVSATQGSSGSVVDGTQAFDVPATCNLLDDDTPETQTICSLVANTVEYSVWVGGSFTAPVTMSASGYPVGSTPTFSPNPVTPVKRLTFLDLAVPAGVANGNYTITMTGNGVASDNETVGLTVYSTAPGAAALSTPANGATGVAQAPSLTWAAAGQAVTYNIQVATDPAFSNIVASATGLAATNYSVAGPLLPQTTYYWRVQAVNPCGGGVYSSSYAFQTIGGSCSNYISTDVPKAISGSGTPSVSSVLNVPGGSTITDINVIGLVGTHTYMGDLDFNLISPAATEIQIIARTCTSTDNFNLNLDDEAAGAPGGWPCPPVGGGTYRPSNALSAFDGQSSTGTWTLRIDDNANVDGGSLDGWGLQICSLGAITADYSDLANNYGTAWHTGNGSLRLGPNWTSDSSFAADVDDASDDGVNRGAGNWTAGANVSLNVTVGGGDGNDYLACWFDWNDNGTLESPGERTVAQNVVNGANVINFVVPAGFNPASNSVLDTRCRLYELEPTGIESTETPTGGVADGEVEDYRWGFSPTAVTLRDSRLASTGNSTWLAGGLAAVMLLSLVIVVGRRREA